MFVKLFVLCFFWSYHLPISIAEESTKIVGGVDAQDGQFPYQVSLRLNARHTCGGSILNSRWILTAAHCVDEKITNNFTVVTGSNLLDTGGDVYTLEKIVEHEKYDPYLIKNDIALLKTNEEVKFTEKVGTIRLPPENTVDGGLNFTLAGWGTMVVGGPTPNNLQTIVLQSITNQECYMKYYRFDLIGLLSSTNICTLNKEGEGACHGDSGGPLVYQDYQVGIVSWAVPCARGKPDVFTRVYSYLDWIRNNTEEST